MSEVEVRHGLMPRKRVATVNEEASKTRQAFKRESDINEVVRRYSVPPPSDARPPMYGDVSQIPDMLQAYGLVEAAMERFEELPADVRKRYANDPYLLLHATQDGNEQEFLREHGVLPPEQDSGPPATPAEAAPTPPGNDPPTGE